MRDLRIVFMGTPDFAVATLQALVAAKYQIVGVITAPDKPAGRGRKLNQSAVKKYALEQNLPILQPTNLKDPDFLKTLKDLDANLQVVVAFRMLPKVVWDMPKYGTFNLHGSLLPNYRGAAPIHWAVINGETKTGVTTFFIDEKIDTGAIILQEEINIKPTDTTAIVHDTLMVIGADLVVKTVALIAKEQVTTQDQKQATNLKTAYKLNRENCKINWHKPGQEIYNLIRGLNPYPIAWSVLDNAGKNSDIKIHQSRFVQENHSFAIGQIIADKKWVKVAVADGFIFLEEMQLPGKRKMQIKDVLNGFTFDKNAKFL